MIDPGYWPTPISSKQQTNLAQDCDSISRLESSRKLRLYQEFKSLFNKIEELVDFNKNVLKDDEFIEWKKDFHSLQDRINVDSLSLFKTK